MSYLFSDSRKNADDEWSSKTEWHRMFRPRLADHAARTIKKGAHVLVEQPDGKGKKFKTTKITSWSIRADAVRRLDRNEQEPHAPTSDASEHSSESSEGIPF